MNFKDTIPVDPAAELSLDNVLTDIRFRGTLGYKLADYNFADGNRTVILEFTPCTPPTNQAKGK